MEVVGESKEFSTRRYTWDSAKEPKISENVGTLMAMTEIIIINHGPRKAGM